MLLSMRNKSQLLLFVYVSCLSQHHVAAFVPTRIGIKQVFTGDENCCKLIERHLSDESRVLPLRVSSLSVEESSGYVLSDADVAPLIRLRKGGKEKVINAFGLWTVVVTLITCPIWAAAMWIVNSICKIDEDLDPNRVFFDKTGKIWSKAWLSMTMSYPTITGDVDRLREDQGACLFVANHASWLDIPVLCTVLDPVFKFISKAELKSVPCIGQQLTGGHHILIDREDRRSQLKTFKDGIGWLNKGVPIMAFPEGKRSSDGRLMDFKGGTFSMAVKTKVPIIPISIANTHAVMPFNALFPVQSGAGKLHVHVHDPVKTEGLTEGEIADAVRAAILSKLPEDQHPIEKNILDDVVASVDEILQQTVERVVGKEVQTTV